MNFTFGNTSTTNQNQNTSLFGGLNTSGFAAPTSNASGGTLFGAQNANTGGSLFGTTSSVVTSNTNTPAFGFGSGGGNLLTQASTSTPNLFGSTNTFGSNTTANNQTGNTSIGGFGTSGFGTNTALNNTNATLGGFGVNATTSQPSSTGLSLGFGTSNNAFGTGSTLGSNSLQTGNTFGQGSTSLFGNKPTSNTGFGMQFGMSNALGQGFGAKTAIAQQPNQQVQNTHPQQREVDPNTFIPRIFNDERDRILGEFNKLQAYWGTGKGFYSPNIPPVEFNTHQSTHKFKAIGFSEIKAPTEDENSNKIEVIIKCNNGYEQLLPVISQYESNLKNLFGMNFNVKIESMKQLPDSKAFLSISVVDTNTNKKLPTFQLIAFYEQPNVKQQFQNAFGGTFVELIKPLSKQEIDEYLKVPPFGIDPCLWDKAKKENPDSKKFIPVALIGFEALNARFKAQVQETDQQKLRLGLIGETIQSLQRDLSTMRAKVEECKRRNMTLSNRVLKTMVWQEIKRKKGYPILAEEDELRSKLESIQNELNAPTKYKGCLNELICKLRHMQSQRQITPKFQLDEKLTKEFEVHLSKEQQGIEHLLELVKNDIDDLKTMKGKFERDSVK